MTERKYTNRRYLDALEKKVLVFDGAMGTSLQVQNLTAEHFGGELRLENDSAGGFIARLSLPLAALQPDAVNLATAPDDVARVPVAPGLDAGPAPRPAPGGA